MAPFVIDEDPDGSGEYTLDNVVTPVAGQWATIESIADVTGVTVTDRERKTATAIIVDLVGLIEGVTRPDITDRDLYFLGHAVAWEAVWIRDNPDLFSPADVVAASQDGESASFRNVDAHILAPLARKSIRRLSWKQPTRPGDRQRESGRINVLDEDYDDSLAWRPV